MQVLESLRDGALIVRRATNLDLDNKPYEVIQYVFKFEDQEIILSTTDTALVSIHPSPLRFLHSELVAGMETTRRLVKLTPEAAMTLAALVKGWTL